MRVSKKNYKKLKLKNYRKKGYFIHGNEEMLLDSKYIKAAATKTSLPKVVLSPVFSSKEQEKLFAECAEKSMSLNARLVW